MKKIIKEEALLNAVGCNNARKDTPVTVYQVAQMLSVAVEALRYAQPVAAPEYVRVSDLAGLLSLPTNSQCSSVIDKALAYGKVRTIRVNEGGNVRYHYGDVLDNLRKI